MRAVRFHRHGGPEVLQCEEIPEPQAVPGRVRVRLKAAGVNHLDLWVRRGLPGLDVPLPHIPGADGAGLVEGTGQRVLLNPASSCGACEFCASGEKPMCTRYSILGEHESGTYAEVLSLPRSALVPIPDWISWGEAAALVVPLVTAWRMLFTRGRLGPGEDVLIWSAGAGVGVFAVQLAKVAGARVIATASSEPKLERLRALGADVVWNHASLDVPAEIKKLTGKRGVDLVVDYIGAQTLERSIRCLRRGGRLLVCGATSGGDARLALGHLFYRQLEIIGSTMGNDRELADALRLVFEKKIRPVVGGAWPLAEAAAAHAALEGRTLFGKAVLEI